MAKETAFHRMAAEFNKNVQNVVSDIKQNISVDVDTRQLDNALDNINRKFNDISSAGPENLQRSIQEAANELDELLKTLQNIGNSSGLDGVSRIIDNIQQGFSDLLGNSVAVKDTFDKMNESISPVVQTTRELSTVLEDVNRKASEGGQFFDQWIATARMLKEDMGGVQSVVEKFKQTAEDASKALLNVDATQLDRALSQTLSNSTNQINDLLIQIDKAVEKVKTESSNITNGLAEGSSSALEKSVRDVENLMKNTAMSVETFKASVQSAGIDSVFDDIIKSMDSNMMSAFDRMSKALNDVPVEKFRETSEGLQNIATSYTDLTRAAQDSEHIFSMLDKILNGVESNNGSAFYVNMLSDGLKTLDSAVQESKVLDLLSGIKSMESNAGSGISASLQQSKDSLLQMKEIISGMSDLRKEAQTVMNDINRTPEEVSGAMRDLLSNQQAAMRKLSESMTSLPTGAGGVAGNAAMLDEIFKMSKYANDLGSTMKELINDTSKFAQSHGLDEQVRQYRDLAEAMQSVQAANRKHSADSFNDSITRKIGEDDPFRQTVAMNTASHVYNQGNYSHGRMINRTRNVENLAHSISTNEAAGVYGGRLSPQRTNMDADAVANKARELQVRLEATQKQKALIDDAFKSGDSERVKELMPGMVNQQAGANNLALDLSSLIRFNEKDLKRAPNEVKQVVSQIRQIVSDVKDSNGNVINIGKILDDEKIREATDELEKFNKTFQETESRMTKTDGFWTRNRMNPFTGRNFNALGALGGAGNSIVKAGTGALGMMGLGGALSLSNFVSGSFGAYRNQGQWEADMALANLAAGGTYNQGEFDSVMGTGMGLHRQTNGMIGIDEMSKNYSSISRNIIGQTGRSSLNASDKNGLAEMSTLFQGAGLASSGQIESAMNVYYKELGMSVKETEYQFSKLLQTSQALNIPFEKQLEQVTSLSKQFKGIGLGADAAANAYLNLTAGGMHEDLAKDYTSSLGKGMTSMNTGMLAYGGLMSGQYADPFSAIGDMKYGLWDKNGNVKEDMADKLTATVDSMADLYAGIAGGHSGAKRMILGDFFTNEMGMSQQQAGMSVERYLENPDFLKEILKDHWSSTAAGAEVGSGTEGMMDELRDAVSSASENLSGIDKTLAAVENSQHRLAKANERALDGMTNFSDEVYALSDMIGGSLGGLAEQLGEFEDVIGKLMAGLAIATLAIPAAAFGAKMAGNLAGNLMGGRNKKTRGRNSTTGTAGSSGRNTNSGGSDIDPHDEDGNLRPRSETHGSRSERNKRPKGRAGALWGLVAAGATTAGILGMPGEAFANGLDSISGGEGGGGVLGNIYGVLKDILTVLSGGTVTGGSAGSGASRVAQNVASTDDYIASHWFNENPGLDLAIAGGYTGAAALSMIPTKSKVIPTTGGTPSRVATAAAAKENSLLSKGSRLLGRSAPFVGGAVAAVDIGSQLKDQHDINKMAGLENYWKDYADIGVEGGARAGVYGGAALGGALGAGFFGIGAIPGALIGGAVGLGADTLIDHFDGYDKLSSLFGLGDDDLKKEKARNSRSYNAGMSWANRYGKAINADIDEGFAVAAGQGLTKYGSQLSSYSSTEKDIWAATYAKGISEGKDEKEAKRAADELFQLNIGQKEAKEINKEQLNKMIEQYGVMESQGVDINTLLKDYLPKDSSERNKIMKATEKATGLSQKELEKISESLGLTLDQMLAMISQSSNGSSNGGFVSGDTDENLRKKLKSKGINGPEAEKVIAAYLDNSRSLSGSNMSEDEKIKWAQAYSGASGVKGLNAKDYADNTIQSYRRDDSVVDSILGDSTWSSFRKMGGPSSEYLKGTSSDKVLDAWAKQTGMSKWNIQQSLKSNGVGQDQFASYLQANRGSGGKWSSSTVESITNGKLVDYSKDTLYTLANTYKDNEQAHKKDETFYGAQTKYNTKKEEQDGRFEEYDKAFSDHNTKQREHNGTVEEQNKSSVSLLGEIKEAIVALPSLIGSTLGQVTGSSSSFGSGGASVPSLKGNDNAEKAFNFLKSQGYSNQAAAAVVGNFMQESNMNPKAVNSIGATGIAQWLGGRKTGLFDFSKKQGLDPMSMEAQLMYYVHETENKEKGSLKRFGMDWDDFKSGTNVSELTQYFRKGFERPGEHEANDPRRIGYANDALSSFGGSSSISSIMSSGSSGSSSGLPKSIFSESWNKANKIISGDMGGPSANMTGMTAKDMVSWYNNTYDVTSRYGDTAGRNNTHGGLDFDGKMGDPIKTVMGGKVTKAVKGWNGGLGNFVEITHSDGSTARYGHLKDVQVSAGDTVGPGTTVGTMGNSGNVIAGPNGDGSHLHMAVKDSKGNAYDPEKWLNNISNGSVQDNFTGGTNISGGSNSETSEEEQAQFFKPIDTNFGKYDPFSGIGNINAKLKNTHNSIYGGAESIAIGKNGVNYQNFVKSSAADFQKKENAFKVDVSVDAGNQLSSLNKEFQEELTRGIQKIVKETAQKHAAKAANDMGKQLVTKLRKDD